MDIYEAVRKRYSCRSYSNRPVPEDLLDKILDAARLAPSANNRQRWRVVTVRDATARKKLAEAARGQTFVSEAPVVLAFCSEGDNGHVMTCGQPSYPIDAAIFIDHVSLLCAAEGLGTCWIGAFHEDQAQKLLGIPREVRVIELMPVGFPTDRAPAARSRLPLEKIVHRERW
ncbi:MAG: nitroreductase family protein [Planctomycetota bacterium]